VAIFAEREEFRSPAKMRQCVRCVLIVFVFILLSASAQLAESPASSLSRVNALWVAESKGVLKIGTADGSLLFEIADAQNVRTVAVDERRQAVWLYAGSTLYCYSFDGLRLLAVPMNLPNPVRADLSVREDDGSVWLGVAQELRSFSVAGAPLVSLQVPQAILSLALDGSGSLLWVGTSGAATAYDVVTGNVVRTVAVSGLRDLSVDPNSGELWVVGQNGLSRYDPEGTLLGEFAIPQLGHVAVASSGEVWAATQKALLHVNASGEVLASLEPFDGKGSIVELVVDPADRSAWVAGSSAIAQVDATGALRRLFAIAPPVNVLDLAISSDTVPPELEILAPADEGFLPTGTPAVQVRFSDAGAGVDSGTLSFHLDGSPFAVTCAPNVEGASCTPASAIPEGRHALSASVRDFAGNTATAETSFTVDTTAPNITVLQPQDGALTNQALLRIAGAVDETVTLTVNGAAATVAADLTFSFGPVSLQEGANSFALVAKDRAGNVGERLFSVTLDGIPPNPAEGGKIHVTNVTAGQVSVTGLAGAAEPGATVAITNARTGATVTVTAGADGSFGATLDAQAGDDLSITLTDPAGNQSAAVSVTVPGISEPGLPPDPATVAPPLDPTVAPDIAASTEFLYTGADPIQKGVAPGTILPERVAVLRGRVLDRSGQPLPGVKISLLHHSELGSTLSRADGLFDVAVNGGGVLVLEYEKEGYLTAQRQIAAPWRDYAWADDVVLVPSDPLVTTVSVDAQEIQVARGSLVEDKDGARRATLLFPTGTHADMVLPDGTSQPLSAFHVRATEYTVGPSGQAAMPGLLPPASGYTYAVELSVDEAAAAGATKVVFSQPVYFYVENFLGFPVGSEVPAGFYDREIGAWVPSENGRVIELLSVTGGMADLDVDGTGAPADEAKLATLGIMDEERRKLATLYQPGETLWRVPIPHFTPWDLNWPYGPPDDAEPPNLPEHKPDDDRDETSDCQSGSIIDCQNQTLSEVLPVVGTRFNLHYRSDRVPGRRSALQMTIPVSGPSVPASLKEIRLTVDVGGQRFQWTFPGLPNQQQVFTLSRQDAYGRIVNGWFSMLVTIQYVYDAVYQGADIGRSFARFSALRPDMVRARGEFVFTQTYRTSALGTTAVGKMGIREAAQVGLGGWTLSEHHFFDPDSQTLHLGTGITRASQSSIYGRVISSPPEFNSVEAARCITADQHGNYYLCGSHRVYKVTPAGTVITIAGTGTGGHSGDGGPALFAQLFNPSGIALDHRGNVFIADRGNCRIRRIDPHGTITTVAGFGAPFCQYSPLWDDGRLATQVGLDPNVLAVDREGNLYIADSNDHYVLKVGLDGLIYRIAGNGAHFDVPGKLPTSYSLRGVRGIAIDPSGNLLMADHHRRRIFRLEAGGTMTLVASAGFLFPAEIAVGQSGEILVHDTGVILKVRADGFPVPIAGNRSSIATGDGGPAAAAGLGSVLGLALDPAGDLFLATGAFTGGAPPKVRKISSLLPGFTADGEILIGSEDGGKVYVFSAEGRHLRTAHALTGATLLSFHYDSRGVLASIEDGDGNFTRIERNAAGTPLAIVSSFGQRTTLALDASGYLARVTNPAGEATRFVYTAGGLLASMTNPRDKTTTFTYDAFGFLRRDSDPAGGFKKLDRSTSGAGTTVSLETAEGRRWEYTFLKSAGGGVQKSTRLPDGLRRTTTISSDGRIAVTSADGTLRTMIEGPDPRFGMESPIASTLQVRTPSGLLATVSRSRTATLQQPGNPLSLLAATERIEINGKAFIRSYDAGQRKLTLTSAAGRQVSTTLDPQGRPVSIEVPGLSPSSLSYDARGRLSTIRRGAGAEERTFTLTYGADGWLSEVLGPLAYRLGLDQDTVGRLLRQTLPDGREIEISYDANGNVTSLTPPTKPSHGFSFTPVDLPAEYLPPALGADPVRTSYSYNLDRRLTQVTRPDDRTVGLSYGTGGRLAAVDFSAGQIAFSYHPTTGNLASVSAPEETVSYTYDGFLLTGTTWSGAVAGAVSRTYDSDFRVSSFSVNGAGAVSLSYDADGFLSQAGALSMTRDPQNGLLTGTALSGVTTTKSYNSFGELESFAASFQGTPLYTATYSHDRLGRITRKVETLGGVTDTYDYTYDLAGRLTDVARNGASLSHYDYDANSNRLAHVQPSGTVTGIYDAQDRLLTWGDRTYTYTANGELATKSQNGHTVTYDYDELGNLRSVVLPEGTVIEYVIDGQNRRIGKRINGILVQGFLYQDQLKPIAELDGAGTIVARFIYGNRPNVPDLMVKNGRTYRLLSDQLGSSRLVVDVVTGAVAQRMDFDEFGRVVLDTNPGFQPFGFAGGIYDRHTRLVRFGWRDYDAEVGRWMGKDPILFSGGDANLYAYVAGDPINLIDPLGLAVTNCSDIPFYVKPEDNEEPIGVLPQGYTWDGSPDGVSPYPKGPWTKTPGKSWLPDNDVFIHKNRSVECTGGPCAWIGTEEFPGPVDPTWVVPKNPRQLPGCKPARDQCSSKK
jgi:RHS repeat-associated protein